MRQYYYTVASLPTLRFDEVPSLTQEDFLEYCGIEASEDDLAVIRSARIWRTDDEEITTGVSASLDAWNSSLQELQRSAALVRAQNIGRDADRIPRPDVTDAGLAERIRQILNEDDPLKAENALLRSLWQNAEELEVGRHFDRDKLLVYHLKLQIASRRARIIDAERGNEEFDRQYEGVARSLMEIAT